LAEIIYLTLDHVQEYHVEAEIKALKGRPANQAYYI